MLKKIFVALVCSILISLYLGIVFTSLYDFGFYLVTLLLIYFIIGIPASFLLDRIANKFLYNEHFAK